MQLPRLKSRKTRRSSQSIVPFPSRSQVKERWHSQYRFMYSNFSSRHETHSCGSTPARIGKQFSSTQLVRSANVTPSAIASQRSPQNHFSAAVIGVP